MATPLLKTKLYIPPVRPELVSRPRLIERLNAGLGRKLTPRRSIGLIIRSGRLWQDDAAERMGCGHRPTRRLAFPRRRR